MIRNKAELRKRIKKELLKLEERKQVIEIPVGEKAMEELDTIFLKKRRVGTSYGRATIKELEKERTEKQFLEKEKDEHKDWKPEHKKNR